jgi:hypothetical protein
MFRITYPGQNVPEWLEKVEVHEGGHFGKLTFTNFNVIWKKQQKYNVLPLIPCLPAIRVTSSKNITITGQGAGVVFHNNPLEPVVRKLLG